jgi:hypothetical protein
MVHTDIDAVVVANAGEGLLMIRRGRMALLLAILCASVWWSAIQGDGAAPGADGHVRAIVFEPELPPAARLRFGTAERALARVTTDATGRMRLDAHTAAALDAAIDAVLEVARDSDPGAAPASAQAALARAAFLVQASLSEPIAGALARQLPAHYAYRVAVRQTLGDAVAHPDPEVERVGLDALWALRQRHLGPEQAQRLYGAEQALAEHLVEMRRLEADTALSPQARAQRRHALEAAYQRRLDGSGE